MKNTTLSTKELLLSIPAMRKQALQLFGKGKPYEELLKEILKYDYYDDEKDHHLASNKELQQKLNLTAGKIKKQLEQIHNNILDEAWNHAGLFNYQMVEYDFYVQGWHNRLSFKGHIPVRPTVGESFDMPFLRAVNNGMGNFYVERVQHELTDEKQIVHVWLKSGNYNSYEQFKKDKDEFERHERWLQSIKNN
ncbi:MAG: hypothetical protein HY840_16065 [Bacteroidetes bacterium]|nr:hypothetical protein [Bacteroidota bacterium]